jgi:hypothetical protein
MINSSTKPERQRRPAALTGLAGIVMGVAVTLVAGRNIPNPQLLLLALPSLASMICPVWFALPGRWRDVTQGSHPRFRLAVVCDLTGLTISVILMLIFYFVTHQALPLICVAIGMLAVLPIGFLVVVALTISKRKTSRARGT